MSLPYKISPEKDGNWAIRELKATSGGSVRDPLVGSKRICESHKAAEATFWIDAKKKQMAPPALYRGYGASGQKPLDFFHPMEIGCLAFFLFSKVCKWRTITTCITGCSLVQWRPSMYRCPWGSVVPATHPRLNEACRSAKLEMFWNFEPSLMTSPWFMWYFCGTFLTLYYS